jgi:hypothetical protein
MTKKNVNKPNWLSLINIDSVYSSDMQRKAFSLFTMIGISIVVIAVLVFLNYKVYSPILTASLIIVNITNICCSIYFIKTGNLQVVALISMSIVCMMFVALVYTGGKDNTALYWLMFYPVVTFASLGVRLGAYPARRARSHPVPPSLSGAPQRIRGSGMSRSSDNRDNRYSDREVYRS